MNRSPDICAIRAKSAKQQAVQQLHRMREQLIRNRTDRINQARGLRHQQGVTRAQGANAVRKGLPEVLEDAEQRLPDLLREVLADVLDNIQRVDGQIARIDTRLNAVQRQSPRAPTSPGSVSYQGSGQ